MDIIVTFVAIQMSNLHTYLNSQQSLDNWSITDIELHISEVPSSALYRLLLAKKMNNNSDNAVMLGNRDRVLYHYNVEVNGKIPTLTDLKQELHEGNQLTTIDVSTNHDMAINPSEPRYMQTDESLEILGGSAEPETQIIEELKPISMAETTEMVDSAEPQVFKSKKGKKKKFKLREFSGISEYAIWLISLKGINIEKKIAKEEKAAKKRALEENAMKSVTKSVNIISESLAEILANQGHLDDAKKMYEQLMQKYPEKSVYFAAKINHLSKI